MEELQEYGYGEVWEGLNTIIRLMSLANRKMPPEYRYEIHKYPPRLQPSDNTTVIPVAVYGNRRMQEAGEWKDFINTRAPYDENEGVWVVARLTTPSE